MFRLSSKGQSINTLLAGGVAVTVFMFLMGFMAMTSSKTKDQVRDGCLNSTGETDTDSTANTINCTFQSTLDTFDNVIEGTNDGADMGKIALFAIPAIFVLGLFIGLGKLA